MNQKPSKTTVLGIPVSSDNFRIPEHLDAAMKNPHPVIVTFVNPHACAVSESNSDYLACLEEFDWVLCDGIGMVIAARRLGKLDIDRAAFDLTSIAGLSCEWLSDKDIPVVLIGGKPGVSDQAGARLKEMFPALNIVKTLSGYDGDPALAMDFLAQMPDAAVICGMGAPRQEQFLINLKKTAWSGIGFTCGGFLDQIIDRVDYYPNWVDKMNLRFLYRLLKEPRRLWRRYLLEYQVFMKRFLKESFSR